MVDYKDKDLFLVGSLDKQLSISTIDGSIKITNTELHAEQFTLTESLCSEQTLRFGCCEASELKFKVSNIFAPMKNKTLVVSTKIDGATDSFQFGRYKVFSDTPTADKRHREVVAYDRMHEIINTNMATWYNGLTFPMSLKQFRDSFFAYFGIQQEEISLINDQITVEKTIDAEVISGQTIITSICEINGCFGHIGRDGKFKYVFLNEMVEGVYPRNDLYPQDTLFPSGGLGIENISKSHYISAEYEDFEVLRINKLQIRNGENDIGRIYPDTTASASDNTYIVQDNFLVFGKSHEELGVIAENLLNVIKVVWYIPASVKAVGNPCLEVGDGIRLSTRTKIIYTYILKRTLTGIQSLRDTYEADGTLKQEEEVNSIHESIVQLRGKTNRLTRTVDETILEMEDMEKDLLAQIRVNAGQIDLKVSKDSIISEINLSPEKITIQAEKIDLVGLVNADEFTAKYATIQTLDAQIVNLQELIAKKATIDSLEALEATVGEINADYASIGELDVEKARIDEIELNYISASTVKAEYMEVANWTSAGYIRADRLNVDELTAGQIYLSDSEETTSVSSASGYLFRDFPQVTKNANGYVTDIDFGSYGYVTFLTRS